MKIVDKSVPVRAPGQKMPFTAYVVEGEGCNDPGRIRTLRFDPGGEPKTWLNCQWADGSDGSTRVYLKGYDVAFDKQEKGAFLLEDEYKRIGRSDIWEKWLEYQSKLLVDGKGTQAIGEPRGFPLKLLPPRVRKLMDMERPNEAMKWAPPEIEGIEDPDEPAKPARGRKPKDA